MKLKEIVRTLIVLAVVLHLFSCVFMGDTSMPEHVPAGARGGE